MIRHSVEKLAWASWQGSTAESKSQSTRVDQAKTIAKESALEVEEEDKILAKKVGK